MHLFPPENDIIWSSELLPPSQMQHKYTNLSEGTYRKQEKEAGNQVNKSDMMSGLDLDATFTL